jgi:alanyl-tRNA synthetase
MARPVTTAEIRTAFLRFFAERGHTVHPSASLVPANDPSTLFTVAGMSQFKDMFLGRGGHPFTRATTCQKCIRTNDIDNVGRTPRHHTFFEMLGNFSFDDYFQRDAIVWAWEFLTGVLALDPERLWVSVNVADEEARRLWIEEVGFPARRIVRLGDHDNFWPADAPVEGPTGPGGCCSEIFWDFQTNDDPADDPGKDSGRFVEIWNLVFPQFNVSEPKVEGRYTLQALGRRNIDTGMGLERIACVMQGVRNNFDIDLLQVIVQRVVAVTGRPYVRDAAAMPQQAQNALLRRIADHARAVSFCIADGALPSNIGRGYIVRRLIRRAVLDLDRLGVEEPALHEVLPAVVTAMGDPYRELEQRRDLIAQTLLVEERQFRQTLRRGLARVNKIIQDTKNRGHDLLDSPASGFVPDAPPGDLHTQPTPGSMINSSAVFGLFTTYGFPPELTADLAREHGLTIDEAGYGRLMAEFAEISKGNREVQVFDRSALVDARPQLGDTAFVGYAVLETDAELTFLEVDGAEATTAPTGVQVRFALDRTPFYGESGGQVGDTGTVTGDGFAIAVEDVQRDGGLVIHRGTVIAGTARPGPVRAGVAVAPRQAITRHHSATHLLHSALGTVLGRHVEQQGSKVESTALRFDFNHPQAVTAVELRQVEDWVRREIAADGPVAVDLLPLDEARRRGAKALFGERYGAEVRMVSMGRPPVSVELCGGCHVDRTGDIGDFRILREEAVAAGVRRITAVAGEAARELAGREAALAIACAAAAGLPAVSTTELAPAAQLLKVRPEELPGRLAVMTAAVAERAAAAGEGARAVAVTLIDRVGELQAEERRLERLRQERQTRAAVADLDGILASRTEVAGVPLYTGRIDGVDAKVLRQVADAVRGRIDRYCLILGAATADKALLICAVSPDLVAAGVHAGRLVGRLARIVGGSGGGKPDLAQAGGKDPARLVEALAAAAGVLGEVP